MLEKLNKLTPKHVAWIFIVVAFIVFFSGLSGAFQGDDGYQIVSNVPVHSLSNFILFFQSSTFYNGQHLVGIYYRPMMSLTFSIIYMVVGAHPFGFHFIQLLLYTGAAFILYLIFKHFTKPAIALILGLIFLVHPLNSQVVFAIPSMQDALFFFFGMLSIWLLITYKSVKSLWWVAACIFLSLLSKETGALFLIFAAAYLFWFDRKRILKFGAISILPVVTYITLKINAVGLIGQQNGAPIDNVHLFGRLMTDPSIVLFYIEKLVFPWQLATGYYWVYPTFSITHTLIPLLIDCAVAALFVFIGIRVKRKLSKAKFYAYLFFALLAVVSILPYLQIIPLDMTVCEDWFYPSFAGVLGMIGVGLLTVKVNIKPQLILLCAAVIILALGIRTEIRGTNYTDQYTLALSDLSASKEDYSAMNNIAQGLTSQGKYKEAASYAQQSINVYPAVFNYNNLGVALQDAKNYDAAKTAYLHALTYGSLSNIYENLGQIQLVYGDTSSNVAFFQKAITAYPHDYKLLVYVSILYASSGDHVAAVDSINTAAKYGPVPQVLYKAIVNNQRLAIPILNKIVVI